jgi:putative endopeptidase
MNNPFIKILGIVFLFLFAVPVCSAQSNQSVDPLVSHIDPSVKAGDDFFLYANGTWFKNHPIPADQQSYGIFQIIQDTINAQIRTLCESSASLKAVKHGSDKQKIGDFFASGMDSAALNKRGIADLQEDIAKIEAVHDLKDLLRITAYLQSVAGSPLFAFGVGQDDRISSKHAILLWQGGLSLPDRNYYFDTDARAAGIRTKYAEHLTRMFIHIGCDTAKARLSAGTVVKLETALAQASRKREETRDPLKNYHKISYQQLRASTPDIDWDIFMSTIGLKNVDTVIVGQPEFFAALNGCLKTFSIEEWKTYLTYHLVRSLASFVDDTTYQEVFNFYGTVLRGIEQPKPRWKRVVEQTDGSLGELIGQVYVKEYLPGGTKEKLLEIGSAIKTVYAERIRKLDWMSEATKVKALKKLDAIIMKVGYPDKWKDMSALNIDRTSYVRNAKAVSQWFTNYSTAKYGKPVDRTEWDMEPQTYNAYYNPSNNEIVVPGCNIIVPGYEHVMADDALLYSVIGGSTFGHEMTHGFDDQGSKYNAEGNLDNWWTPEDSIKFTDKTKLVVEEYNQYVAVDSLHINGELTQGENIADIGGIMMGYQAFKKTAQYKKNVSIGGLNPDQRFFLGYAMAWMENERPEAVANQVRSNEHSPSKFRVLGPLSNMPEFFSTFGIKAGDPMWRPVEGRVVIW